MFLFDGGVSQDISAHNKEQARKFPRLLPSILKSTLAPTVRLRARERGGALCCQTFSRRQTSSNTPSRELARPCAKNAQISRLTETMQNDLAVARSVTWKMREKGFITNWAFHWAPAKTLTRQPSWTNELWVFLGEGRIPRELR